MVSWRSVRKCFHLSLFINKILILTFKARDFFNLLISHFTVTISSDV